ncbi:adenosylcobinamide-phosphate guanylyltransferase [Haladaptatus litoreus]|uniref:Adenosylcobinamide-phosphate guanylyltransferase n=1 Tax=Haladaptatus litoreus TaxID=553468 RepID=A0A1N7CSN3_9EURY|nr:NTP transferase domain-containing protein [Haladaptatus litoreus]SIR66666.1 adenosylcobinamide-phosphate guanylyltransferase [Haladaptatus litoreus]
MCGGKGTRLDASIEKPMFEIDGTPMVDRIYTALAESRIDAVHAVVSPHTPETQRYLDSRSLSIIAAPGDGYVEDLSYALERVELPILTVVSDLPLLAGECLDRVLSVHDRGSLTVCAPVALKQQLGVGTDTTFEHDGRELAPTGLNIVGDGDVETTYITYDARLAVNVNRQTDAAVAEAFI